VDHVSQTGALGRVLSVGGSQAQVRLAVSAQELRATVGKFLGINAGNAVVIGVITKIGAEAQSREGELAVAAVDMLGEIKRRRTRRVLPARRHRISHDRRRGGNWSRSAS
jgi:hypothetical protein